MRVEDLMTRPLVTIGHDATVAAAWRFMPMSQVRHLPVLDADRRLRRILTDHDLRQVILERTVREEPDQLARTLTRPRVNSCTLRDTKELLSEARPVRGRGDRLNRDTRPGRPLLRTLDSSVCDPDTPVRNRLVSIHG